MPLTVHLDSLSTKGFLIPALITIAAVVSFQFNPSPMDSLRTLLVYLTAVSVYVVYRVCGKPKPWWVFLGVAMVFAALMIPVISLIWKIPDTFMPVFWKPPEMEGAPDTRSVWAVLGYNFFHTAFSEELLKILPVLLAFYFAGHGRFRESFSVREPIDGILLGVAAAGAFTVVEGWQYAQGAFNKGIIANKPVLDAYIEQVLACRAALGKACEEIPSPTMSIMFAMVRVFKEVIFRSILLNTFGHAAFSGIFGYYVGLAALRPHEGLGLMLRGFLIAMSLHAMWNTVQHLPVFTGILNQLADLAIAGLAYGLLISCILQARKISPSRTVNFATTLGGSS
jgi:RsiW-degrading membrane proteinase PrsW (M82 family)